MIKELETLQELLDQVDYKYGLKFKVDQKHHGDMMFILKSRLLVDCSYRRDGSKIELSFEQELPVRMIEKIIPDFNIWIRSIIMSIEKHEIDEWLLINKERVFDPHK